MDPELREELQVFERNLGQKISGEVQASESRMREHMGVLAEGLRAEIRGSEEETRRHMGVLVEGFRADFRIATEAITPISRRLDALEGRVSALERQSKPRRPPRR